MRRTLDQKRENGDLPKFKTVHRKRKEKKPREFRRKLSQALPIHAGITCELANGIKSFMKPQKQVSKKGISEDEVRRTYMEILKDEHRKKCGSRELRKKVDRRGYRIVWLNETDGLKLHLLPLLFASRFAIGGVRQILFLILCGFARCLGFLLLIIASHFKITLRFL